MSGLFFFIHSKDPSMEQAKGRCGKLVMRENSKQDIKNVFSKYLSF